MPAQSANTRQPQPLEELLADEIALIGSVDDLSQLVGTLSEEEKRLLTERGAFIEPTDEELKELRDKIIKALK